MFEFAKEKNFDEKAWCNKRNSEKNPTTLLRSPAMKAGCLDENYFSKWIVQLPKEKKDGFIPIFLKFVIEKNYY